MVFDLRTIFRGLDKKGNPGTQAMVQAEARQRVNPIYKAEDQEPDKKATQKTRLKLK